MSPAAWFALGAVSATIVIAAILYVRNLAGVVERWGLELSDYEDGDPAWRGLEDKRPRVSAVHDWKRTGEL